LLLVARYREELHRHQRPWDAMKVAWRSAAPAVVASAATVILALLCMLVSELEGNKGLGPVAAIGVASAVLTQLVLLPAMLLAGRWLFWPRIPHRDGQDPVHEGFWATLATRLTSRPLQYSVATVLALVVLALGTLGLQADGLSQSEQLTTRPSSVVGQEHLARHFSAGTGTPVDIVGPAGKVDDIVQTARTVPGVALALPYAGDAVFNGPAKVVTGQVLVEATLSVPGDSTEAERVVQRLRAQLDTVSKDVLVGGFTAINSDIIDASKRDNRVIIPLVLVLITGVLALLLRSVAAPVLLIATVVLSFTATLGACAIAFNHLFDFPGADPSFPLFAFVFLVGLGVDYNIFLMTRVREEARTHPTGEAMQRGLTVTGGVITSAGIVLAATFAVLATLPIVSFAQVGFAVAFGVVLDTFVVRSVLVPALTLLLGDRVWWPGKPVDNR
jgi:RND superfamily putative drug exporter